MKTPLFEVRRAGITVMQTNDPRCIYDAETLRSMQKSGHTFRYNGKSCPLSAIPTAHNEKGKPR